tara:strand:+ start:19929 stop:22088 length:2160 start_codon:yes stop_codon:yes gene_type:complete
MAKLYPDFETIMVSKVKPEPGELHLLKFLVNELDDSFEIFFNPYLNGDRPDVVILKKGFGVLVIEVKDYNLNSYELDNRKNWNIKNSNTRIKSPISQVLRYKENFFDLHIEELLEKKIKNWRLLNVVSCAVYFHNASRSQVEDLLVKPYEHDSVYLKFLNYNINLLGRDNLNELDIKELLRKTKLSGNRPSALFTEELYNSFKRFIHPPRHLIEHGKPIPYSKRQMEIIYSNTREQRIKGVVGSGKTTILAARAVQAYKRTKGKILILTFNITLKNYIHDKISDVREEFPWQNFIIMNYHSFINSELNNLNIDIEVPDDFNSYSQEEKDEFFESEYYSNKPLFDENRQEIVPYEAIFIDEIQDYKREWMDILKDCFLEEGGEYVLFGDVKQNIYNIQTLDKDVSTNVRGVNELKYCFRSGYKIRDLAVKFQETIFSDKYEIDSFNKSRNGTLEIDYKSESKGLLNYIYLENTENVSSLYTIIHENIKNKNFIPNDITVLSNSIALIKKFDTYYRYSCHEKTHTMFETNETELILGLNDLVKLNNLTWIKPFIKIIGREKDYDYTRAMKELSVLFTIHELSLKYPKRYDSIFDWYCKKYKCSQAIFDNVMKTHLEDFNKFREHYSYKRLAKNLKNIRNNKKLHFYLNSGTIKLSTIHSFKGWESDTVFLIIEKKFSKMENSFDEILYTGLTRSRKNLVIINFGNKNYDEKLKTIVSDVTA